MQRLTCDNVDAFHRLVVDEYVRRYLLDGELVDRAWCSQRQVESDALFAECGLGLWLASAADKPDADSIGFCGFIQFAETGPDPQLVYALLPDFTGQGLATEIARALIDYARTNTRLAMLHSAVDEPNVASCRVLEKVGFERTGERPGAFGRILEYELPLPTRS